MTTRKKKPAAKSKSIAKRKAAIRSNIPARPLPPLAESHKLVSIFWAQFERGAVLPVDEECLDRAIALGALRNVRKNLGELSEYGKVYEDARKCSLRAGKKAYRLALASRPRKKSIDADTFEEAFNWVAASYGRMLKASGKKSETLLTVLC